jgi:hypothetical protein
MDRISEIKARCEEGRPLRRVDTKYLLVEVERLTDELLKDNEYAANLTAENERLGAEVERKKAREVLVPKLVDAAERMFNARCYCQDNELSVAVSAFWRLWDEWRGAAKGGGE